MSWRIESLGALRLRTGESAISFRDSLSYPIDAAAMPVFKPGDDFIRVDVSKLPQGSAVLDNDPSPGHVSVKASPAEMKNANRGEGDSTR